MPIVSHKFKTASSTEIGIFKTHASLSFYLVTYTPDERLKIETFDADTYFNKSIFWRTCIFSSLYIFIYIYIYIYMYYYNFALLSIEYFLHCSLAALTVVFLVNDNYVSFDFFQLVWQGWSFLFFFPVYIFFQYMFFPLDSDSLYIFIFKSLARFFFLP